MTTTSTAAARVSGTIKALEWAFESMTYYDRETDKHIPSANHWDASAKPLSNLMYQILELTDPRMPRTHGIFHMNLNGKGVRFDSLAAAKAAAQADYDARILAAIEPDHEPQPVSQAALQPDQNISPICQPEPQPVAASTVRYRLEWLAGARPPAHPEPMKGSATFDTQEDALAFFSRLADDAKPLSLTRTETITTRVDLPSALRALAGEGER